MADDTQAASDRIGAAIGATAATVDAPAGLRARIAATGPPPRRSRRMLAAATVCVGAAIGIAVGLVAISDDERAPTIASAAAAALRSPAAPSPGAAPASERFVRARVGTVRFPNYGYDSGWTVAGIRRDELAGRDALTVIYRGWGDRIGYTVVDGAPLERPAGARQVVSDGRRFAVLRRGGALVVTWRQGGHTCVLASRSAPLKALLALATWS
jgi:hypothetical protein